MNSPLLAFALGASAALFLAPRPAATSSPAAQGLEFPQASPAAAIEQTIGLTEVSIHYCRPGMKGRKIFGALEPYGKVWRTGANTSTTIEFSADVKFGGEAVPAGAYSLFSIPGEKEWTVILNKTTGKWGAYSYDEKEDLVRVKVKPVALAEPVETFEFGFANVRAVSASLYFEWERVRVPVAIETGIVEKLVPQVEQVMAGSGQKNYFAAAMFYYDNDLDMKKAAEWIDKALAEDPDALWIVYRKGLILERLGDKAGATAAAKQSLEMASKEREPLKSEYTRLNEALLERLR